MFTRVYVKNGATLFLHNGQFYNMGSTCGSPHNDSVCQVGIH